MAKLKKPIVILTNFWDAESILKLQSIFIDIRNSNKVCRLNFLKDQNNNPKNFSVYSIALSHPNFSKLPNLNKAFKGRIDCFCPTYNMVMDYKETKNWLAYIPLYKDILVNRKERILKWFDSLEKDHIYLLCCWENIKGKSHCHRELLYKVLLTSKKANDKLYPILREG